ncbi:MAG TPA: FAD-binding oxidoreductase, partial [Kribbella sp.]
MTAPITAGMTAPVHGTPTLTNHEHYVTTSHESMRHDSIANLGYDWSRIADPGVAARPPFKVYLPRTTEDVVRAVIESKDSGEPLVVRGHGHSSNNLVTPEHGVVLLTEHMNRIVAVDEKAMTVTVQAGAMLMGVDLYLSEQGLGLSIIGDHDHITAAGFASVGGISPASHRYGMFVDTVAAIEYVDWAGKVHQVNRRTGSEDLMRLLCGTGRHGVITELTIEIVRVDKFRTVYRNNRHLTTDVNDFVRYSNRMIREPGDAVMERGVWADFGLPGARLGQFSSYHTTNQAWYKSLWNDVAYGVQHLIGDVAGRLPTALDDLTKYVGMACIMLSPQYAGQKNIERFTDQILDSTVGDPTRMFVVLAPAERYESLFHQLNELAVAERRRSGAITFISIYVKSIRSQYLSGATSGGAGPTGRHCEIMLYLGVRPEKMTTGVLDRLVNRIDRLAAQAGAYRYLHSLTSTDPTLRQKVDPNSR